MTFKKTSVWSGFASVTLFALLWATRSLASATESAVFFAGRELVWGCAFKRVFGIACPGCGMTRSIVLALDGDVALAFAANPAGPLLVFGALASCAALLFAALSRPTESARTFGLPRKLKLGAATYGGLLVVVMALNWLRVVT